MVQKSSLAKGILLLFAGLVALAGTSYLLNGKITFLINSTTVQGTVIELKSQQSRKTTYYYPIISFSAEDGTDYTFTAETGTSAAFDFAVGDKVSVRYDKVSPHIARVNSFMELWGLASALMVMSLR